ncbi:MAG: LEVG family PEP-CTERM protein [Crocosphaera sp.]|nr:LEVG family PEP-CTERM protein [Crocosphaera sp.]
MNQLTKYLSKYVFPVAVTAVTTIGIPLSASAQIIEEPLVPQEEGEVDLFDSSGIACLDPAQCLDVPDLIGRITSIESLVDSTTGTKSRLFVDHFDTANSYGSGPSRVVFGKIDLPGGGTTSPTFDENGNPIYWYRPSERRLEGGTEERGNLEVGTFKFSFSPTIPQIKIQYFDVESGDTTGLLGAIDRSQTDADLISGENPIPVPVGDKTIYEQIWANVNFITIKLGNDTMIGTGDGVNFIITNQIEVPSGDPAAVPEPLTILGAGAAMGFGGFFKRKLAKSSKKKDQA